MLGATLKFNIALKLSVQTPEVSLILSIVYNQ